LLCRATSQSKAFLFELPGEAVDRNCFRFEWLMSAGGPEDQDSIDACYDYNEARVFSGLRQFRH